MNLEAEEGSAHVKAVETVAEDDGMAGEDDGVVDAGVLHDVVNATDTTSTLSALRRRVGARGVVFGMVLRSSEERGQGVDERSSHVLGEMGMCEGAEAGSVCGRERIVGD